MNNCEIFLQNSEFSLSKLEATQIKNNAKKHKENIKEIYKLFYIEKTLDLDITDDEQKEFADFIVMTYKSQNNKNKENKENKNKEKQKSKSAISMIDEISHISL
jgi:hypothetical protein